MNPAPIARALSKAALLVLTFLPGAVAAESDLDPRRIGWSELDLEASKLGLSIESRLRIRRLSATELERLLVEPGPGEWLPAPESGGWLVDLETRGLGKRSRLELMLDSGGRSLQRSQIESGRRLKHYRNRTHRFARGAVHIDTRKPAANEREADPGDWSRHSEWVLELPEGVDDAPGQASGLFYTLGASNLFEPGDRMTTYVLSKGRVMEVELTVEARERLRVDYVEIAGSSTRQRRGEIGTLQIRLSGRGVGPDASQAEFRFLGLRGDVRVHLDAASRAPVLITGQVGWLGRAKVKLRRLVLGTH